MIKTSPEELESTFPFHEIVTSVFNSAAETLLMMDKVDRTRMFQCTSVLSA